MHKLIIYNIFKHKFIFSLIGLLILLLCFYLIVGLNTIFSVSQSLKTAVRDNMTGDVIIMSKKKNHMDMIAMDSEKKLIPLENPDQLLSYLADIEYVVSAAPRLRVRGMLVSEQNSAPFIIMGVVPEAEEKLVPKRKLYSGKMISNPNEINLYYRHSDFLSTNVGNNIEIKIQTLKGQPNPVVAKLVGTYDYSDLAIYTEFAFFGFVELDFLNSILSTEKRTISEVCIRLKDGVSVDRLRTDLNQKFGDSFNYVLPEESANLISSIYKLIFFTVFFIASLLLLMVYLGSSFLVSLSLETRRQEIGIYSALGVKKWRIGLLFGGEFLFVVIIFGVLGFIFGSFFMRGLSANGIEASIIPLQLIFGRSVLFVTEHVETYFIIVGVLLTAFVVNVLDVISKFVKLDPITIMREL